jgi:hypothetical protein
MVARSQRQDGANILKTRMSVRVFGRICRESCNAVVICRRRSQNPLRVIRINSVIASSLITPSIVLSRAVAAFEGGPCAAGGGCTACGRNRRWRSAIALAADGGAISGRMKATRGLERGAMVDEENRDALEDLIGVRPGPQRFDLGVTTRCPRTKHDTEERRALEEA